jgi:drug/metabolite transporter (DMT)-like permease
MAETTPQPSSLFNRIPGRAYLILAVLIFAAANSVTRQLTHLGAQHPIDGRNPISFCNVLFVGNLCALIMLIVIYHKQITVQQVRHLSRRDWWALIGVAVLAGALAPALFFMALDQTGVNNVVLIGRVEPPLTLVLSVLLLREQVNSWVIAGAVLSFVGVGLTILLQPPSEPMIAMLGVQMGRGQLLALGGAIAAALATIISKVSLHQIPFGLFNVTRTTIATIVFFAVVILIYGPHHFADVLSPFIWAWMLLYGAVIVVGGQLSWFEGLKRTTASEVSLASSFSPIAGVLAAYFILGEIPTMAQYIGGVVILLGIALNQVGVSQLPAMQTRRSPMMSDGMDAESGVGFKGI